MSRGVRISLASIVLFIGTILAMLFPHSAPSPLDARCVEVERPIIQPSMNPKPVANPLPKLDISKMRPPQVTEASPVRPAVPASHAMLEAGEPPPEMARVYPQLKGVPFADSPEVTGYRLPQPTNARPAQRIHKVADGDTLALLAKRYLGSADRALEIVRLNGDILHGDSPEALPIGIELKIPPRNAPPVRVDEPSAETRLVPVPL